MDLPRVDANPVFPCICGHLITAHGEYTDAYSRIDWDDDHKEQIEVQEPYPRAVCYDCGPNDCYFIEMDNLEYIEFKANGNNQRQQC